MTNAIDETSGQSLPTEASTHQILEHLVTIGHDDGPRRHEALLALSRCFRAFKQQHGLRSGVRLDLEALAEQAEFTSQRLRAAGLPLTAAARQALKDTVLMLSSPEPSVAGYAPDSKALSLIEGLVEAARVPLVDTSDCATDLELFVSEAAQLLDAFRRALVEVAHEPEGSGEAVASAFRAMHTLKGNAVMIGDAVLERLAKQAETALHGLRATELAPTRELLFALRDLATEMLHHLQSPEIDVEVERLEHVLLAATSRARHVAEGTRLGDLLVAGGFVSTQDIALAIAIKQEPLGEGLVRLNALDASQLEHALSLQRGLRTEGKSATLTSPTPDLGTHRSAPSLVSVDAARLGALTQTVDHLVRFLGHNRQVMERAFASGASQEIERLLAKTEELLLKIDEVSVGPLLRRMSRLASEISRELGKNVEMTLQGGDIEVHRSVVNAISDPLLHLVRNAVDHGIEPTEHRVKHGKCPFGSIMINVRLVPVQPAGTRLVVEVSDDGRGIDRSVILEKATSMGLISSGEAKAASDDLVYGLIFRPGFTSKNTVSRISGLGVGMDVVKTSVEAAGGTVHVKSVLKQGTKILMSVPNNRPVTSGAPLPQFRVT